MRAWRDWRRSRPFWGGLFMLLAGAELIAIPVSGVLGHGEFRLVIYIGSGGILGVLIGALLIAAALLVWLDPAHRMFYGIVGAVLGIASFPATNLGGFFLGMLLAITGGALGFGWTPLGTSAGSPAKGPAGSPAKGPAGSPAKGAPAAAGSPSSPAVTSQS